MKMILGLRTAEANGRLVCARELQAAVATARQRNRAWLARFQPGKNRLVIHQNLAEPPPGVHSNSRLQPNRARLGAPIVARRVICRLRPPAVSAAPFPIPRAGLLSPHV